LAMTLDNFGIVLSNLADYTASIQCRQEALSVCEEIGDKNGVARALNNIGRVLCLQGEYSEAKSRLQESWATSQEMGNREMMMFAQLGLGVVACGLGDYSQSENYCRAALRITMDIRAVPIALHALVVMATLFAKRGHGERSLELLALALDHPATTLEAKQEAEPLLAELVAALPPDVITTAQARGRVRSLDQVVTEILAMDQ
jgi:tetratricopeptide (TPR) repeat protein